MSKLTYSSKNYNFKLYVNNNRQCFISTNSGKRYIGRCPIHKKEEEYLSEQFRQVMKSIDNNKNKENNNVYLY